MAFWDGLSKTAVLATLTLEEDLAVQELPVGASLDDVKFPSTLKATVESVEEVEVQKAVEEEPKEGDPVEEEPAEAEPADPAEEEAATEPAETVDDTDGAVQEPESDTEAELNETPAEEPETPAEQKEATPEAPASTDKDSESVDTSFIDIIFPAIVAQAEEAEEEPVEEPTEETEKKAVQKEVTVEVTEWKTTDGKAFDSSTEASFVYEPVLKTDYAVASALPTIKVNIVNTKSKAAFEKSQVVDGVRVTVKADAGVFPEGATLSVAKVSGSEEQAVEAAVDEKRDDNKNKVEAYTFDIKVLDKDGNEIEPDNSKGKVKVSFTLEEVANENLETDVYHIKGEVGSLSVDELNAEEVGDTTVEATTDGFSYYTVEFTYNNLQYVMNGDTTVALSEILDSVGLSGNIEAVVSSNPELFKVENNGSIWQVTAVQAFHSDETLTVTLDGVEYVITVTDEETYGIWVGGTQVTDTNKDDIPVASGEKTGTASFNPANNTLILDNFTYEGDCATGLDYMHAVVCTNHLPSFNLVIKGTVDITQNDNTDVKGVCGIYIWADSIDIGGEGINSKLIVHSGNAQSKSTTCSAALSYSTSNTPTIHDCTIEATSTDTNSWKGSFGLNFSKGPVITNCIINAYGGTNATLSGGINIGDSSAMEIHNSTVVATSAASSGNSYGIYSNYGTLHIDGQNDVTLRGYSAASQSTIYFHDISGMCYDNYDMLGDPTIVTQYSSPPPPKEPAKAIRAVPHTHSFTYAASGDTITATCSADGCSLTDSKVTLKIVKPTLSVEGGTGDAAATLEGLTGYNAATGLSLAESNIEYATAGSSNYSSTAPTTKGSYVARITAGTVTALVSYEIGKPPKAAPSADDARTAAKISYINEAVTPDGVEISSSDESYVPVTSLTSVLDESSTPKIYVRYPADDDYGPSAWVEVALTPRPSAPEGLIIVNASSDTAQDGMIDGTTTAMEYKEAGDSSYRPASDGSTLVAPGTYMVRTKAADDTPASVSFQVVIQAKTNQEPPSTSGISVVNTTGNDSNGKISGLAAGMEYSVDGGNTWQTVVGTELNNIQAGEYLIRYPGNATKNPSTPVSIVVQVYIVLDNSTELVINKGEQEVTTPEIGDTLTVECPAQGLSYQWLRDGEVISGAIGTSYTATLDDLGKALSVKVTQVEDRFGAPISGYTKISEPTQPVAKQEQAAPSTATLTPSSTTRDAAEGTINGVTTDMEYSPDGGDTWISITESPLTGLKPGVYLIRYAGDETKLPSEAVVVVIEDSTPEVVVETGTIKVTAEKDTPDVPNTPVYITIKKGNEVVFHEKIGTLGVGELSFEFPELEIGSYTVICKADDGNFTETQLLNVVAGKQTTASFRVLKGEIKTVVEVVGDTPPVAVDGLRSLLTEEEKDLAATTDGYKVEIKLIADEKKESEAAGSENIKEKLEGNQKLDQLFDFSLTKTITNGGSQSSTEIKDATSILEIAIPYDLAEDKILSMFRFHDNTVETLKNDESKQEGTFFYNVLTKFIHLFSSKFSTYAIATEDATVPSSGGSDNSSSDGQVKTIPVYRLYNTKIGDHLYTTNKGERDILLTEKAAEGWTDEGIAWQAAVKSDKPVYRLFDVKGKAGHFFTSDITIRNQYIANGWRDEGIAWYATPYIGRKVYKITNQKTGKYHFTISKPERDILETKGYTCEEAEFTVY